MPLTQYQIKEFTRRARAAGLSDDQIRTEIEKKASQISGQSNLPSSSSVGNISQQTQTSVKRQQATYESPEGQFNNQFISSLVEPSIKYRNEPKSVEGFAGNVAKSAVKNVGDILSAAINVLNPNMDENTVANIAKLGIDAVKLAGGDKQEANRAKQLVQFYKKRYGEDLEQTLYEDPVGVLLDLSTVLGGAGAAAKGAGSLSKVSGLTKAGNTLTRVGAAIDPIAQTGKLASNTLKYTKVADKVSDSMKALRKSIAEEAARRSLRANPTQMTNFQELIGTADAPGDVGKWMTENGIYVKEDVTKQIKAVQKQYNAKVRTDTPITGKQFADALRKKASEIELSDQSPSAREVVAKLKQEADLVETNKNLTDTILTNSKTSQFGKVSKKAMTDPITENFNKAYGEVGLRLLDEIAPGSAELGKKLQILREFDNIVSKQMNLGKGSQLVNVFKPFFAGAVSGAAGGSFIPGVGSATGAVVLGTGASFASNPYVQRSAARILTEGISVSEGVKNTVSRTGQTVDNVSRAGRMITADQNQDAAQSDQLQIKPQDQLTTTSDNIGSPSYPESISQPIKTDKELRKEAVQILMQQGIVDPDAQLEILNYDVSGKKVGDFTISEVIGYQGEERDDQLSADRFNSVAPSPLNPFGNLSKRQVISMALSQGASRKDIEDLEWYYDKVAGDAMAITQETMQVADGLRTEYFKRTKENGFLEVSQAYSKVVSTSDSPAGDLSLIFAYMKMLDPGSVVREGEFANAENAAGVPERIKNQYNKTLKGNKLTPKQRAEFRGEAQRIFGIYQQQQAPIDEFYQGLAMRYGIDPTLVGVGLYQ